MQAYSAPVNPRRFHRIPRVRVDVGGLVERFNLRRVWYWMGLSGLVGVVGGLGAIAFKWLVDLGVRLFWNGIIGYTPPVAYGEPLWFPPAPGPPWLFGLILAPVIGGLGSALLVYRFAPEAEGHGTDAAIKAYHRQRGRLRARIPLIKLLASAFTLASGGSAGREGPIAQIGAGFGSVLGGWLHLSDRERRILLAAGVAAGLGAIFRAPLAGAIFAAEVLYSEPDIEAEVVVPALLSSIVSYTLYCSVHGFGHLFEGTAGFAFHQPLTLIPYVVLGLVSAFGAIAYVSTFSATTRFFKRLPISNYFKPIIGGALTGMIGLVGYLLLKDTNALAVMGSGYGFLQKTLVSGGVGPAVSLLGFVALGKMATTSLTIGSGGSGGIFGPSMVIGGSLGAMVGTLFHAFFPELVPDIGPFTIVGMAGFFSGAANTPISTLLMVADMTGNYSLLLPAMLAVGLSVIIAHRWTIYPEQVPTRSDSPAHRGEFIRDVLADLEVGQVFDPHREIWTVQPDTSLREIMKLITTTTQQYFPVVSDGKLTSIFSLNDLREVLYEEEIAGLVVAADLATGELVRVTPTDTLERALELLTLRGIDELPVVDPEQKLLGMLTRRDIIAAYNTRLLELRSTQAAA